MIKFAFKCTKCNTVTYSNTTRRVSMRCSKCGAFNIKRSAKDDKCEVTITDIHFMILPKEDSNA